MKLNMICDLNETASIKNVTINSNECIVDFYFHSKYACPLNNSESNNEIDQQRKCPFEVPSNLDVYVVGKRMRKREEKFEREKVISFLIFISFFFFFYKKIAHTHGM